MIDLVVGRIVSEIAVKPKSPEEADAFPLPPDPVIEAYKKDVDRTLLRQSLNMTVEERIRSVQRLNEFIEGLQRATRGK
jgi:hypothetical protein